MLPSGAAPVPTLPPAPADRPEAPEPDASDSRFASLMAQFVPPQAQVPAPAEAATPTSPTAATAAPAAGPVGGPAGGVDRADATQEAASTPSLPGRETPKVPTASPAPAVPAADVPPPALASPTPLLPTAPPAAPEAPATPSPASTAPAPPTTSQAPGPAGADPAPAPDPAAGNPPPARALKADLLLLAQPQSPSAQVAEGREPAPVAAPTVPSNPTAALAGIAPPPAPAPTPRLSVIAAPGATQPSGPVAASGPVATPGQPAAAAPAASAGPAPTRPDAGNGPSQEATAKADAATTTFQVHLHPEAATQAAVAATWPAPVPDAPAATSAPPAAPAATTPVATPPVAQVDSGMKWMLRTGAQEARLQLHPDSLGQVTIHLRVEGGEVHAKLWVSEPASVQAVQEGRPHLELSLKEQGLQLGSFDLQQGHRPFQEAAPAQGFGSGERAPALQARQETPAAIVPTLANPHQIELYA